VPGTLLRWAASAAVLALAAAGVAGVTTCGRGREPARLVIGELAIPSLRLLPIARGRGLFRAEGVEVVPRPFDAGKDALAALLAGEVDLATVYEPPVAARAFETTKLRILTTLHWSQRSTRLLVREDREIGSVGELRGLRVGVPFDTSAELFLETELESAGLRLDEVERVDLPPARATAALEQGVVDAVAVWLPHGAPSLGGPRIVELPSTANVEISMLVTREDVLASKTDALRRVLRALANAERLARSDPSIALAELRRLLPHASEHELREGIDRNVAQIGLSHLLLHDLQRAAEWHLRRRPGAGAAIPDFRPLLAPGLLLEVEPESVTLLGVEGR
jgi:NitT/TauT family transport system substrate-binding protein